ncbi:protein of unknown function DUF1501 [Pirellula staleyi DSM 6068]|uniref:DUF1501 domain-containing protein n=1 Tax=Pirellula staleyi (strain ATCC 27377 / DSM 6068 / ICPB 4128) TaxID=530564 RepID=D2QXS0_PIRSD|nr:DUF1501 domain-containing protein [Pirellula staleyi]ADB17997.1 protein of unknown function DUF1501 [Pirellula staleyi DSM 6068]
MTNLWQERFSSSIVTRRQALLQGGAGFGALALASLVGGSSRAADTMSAAQRNSGAPHHAPRAKSVIFLFMEGGPSHIDLFDPKPELNKLHGQQLPSSFKPIILAMGENNAPLMGCKRTFQQHGEGGMWFSDWLPHLAERADDIALIRSCWADGINHSGGVCQMNTGSILAGRPSLGSWVTYGLGSENQDLPAFIVMQDNAGQVVNGVRNWGSGFMPAGYQGTRLEPTGEPIRNLHTPESVGDLRQREKLDYLNRLNQLHLTDREHQTELDARIKSYELAFRMQAKAPEAVDLTQETEETSQLYGLDAKETAGFGKQCLLARRLVERGVRFVQLYHGAGSKWDSHAGLERNHASLCKSMDKPVAGLLEDLKRRGLLESTLVVWGGEFGRTPQSEQGDGRDHNAAGFSMWMAGAGIQGGRTWGATDEIGLHAIENRLHVHDIHATILHLLGIDHMGLVYAHKGRPERATLNEGEPFLKLVTG